MHVVVPREPKYGVPKTTRACLLRGERQWYVPDSKIGRCLSLASRLGRAEVRQYRNIVCALASVTCQSSVGFVVDTVPDDQVSTSLFRRLGN